MTVLITRTDLDAKGLRLAASRCRNAAASRRMLALALVLEGRNRTEAATAAGMDRQTLRDWAELPKVSLAAANGMAAEGHRYNEHGLAGLTNLPNHGAPPRKLTPAQEVIFAEWVRQGPDLQEHKVVRWRLADLRGEIDRQFGIQLHERTVGKLMARLNFSRVSVRPRHPEQDIAAQEAHKKNLRTGRRPTAARLPQARHRPDYDQRRRSAGDRRR